MKALQDYLSKHHKTHIIFDFDATVFHLLLPWDNVYNEIYDELVALDPEIMRGFRAGEHHDGITRYKYFKKFGEKANKIIIPHIRKFEVEQLKSVRINHDLVEFIKNDNEHVMYIGSANTRKPVVDILKKHGILGKFKKIVTLDDVIQIKPDTEGFKLINDGKTPISDYLFVGDSSNDEGAAKALGMDFFKVSF